MISITDGQIYLETDLFNSGIRPAINVGLSVSRVGGNAQIGAMKQLAGTLRLDLAQYRELAAFSQFGSDLDKATQALLSRGQRLTELLKQDQYVPLPLGKQILALFAGTQGYLDDIPVEAIRSFEAELFRFVDNNHPALLPKLLEKKKLDDALRQEFGNVITQFKERFLAERKAQSPAKAGGAA